MRKLLLTILLVASLLIFAEEITITAWTVGPDNPSYYRFENLKTAAERLNKILRDLGVDLTIKVDGYFDTTDWSSFKQKVVFGIKSGQVVDIVCSGHDDIGAWARAGYIIPLDEYVKKYWDEVYYDFIPSLWESTKYKGKIYGIPQDTEARPFYINKQVLKKLGWSDEEINSLPERIAKGEFTFEDFIEVAKEAVEKGYVEWGIYHRPKAGIDYYQLMISMGIDFYDEENAVFVYNVEDMKRYYKLLYDLANTYKILPKNMIGTPWTSVHKDVTSGKVLAWMGGTWNWAEWKKDYGKTEEELQSMFILAPVPKFRDKGRPNTLSHPIVYMIPSTSKHPDIAFLLITLASAPELNMRHAVESGHLPIRWQQTVLPEYTKEFIMVEGTKLLPYSGFIPNDDMFNLYNQIIFEGMQMAEGGMNPEKVAEDVAKRLKSQLKDRVVIIE
ncbi:ABC transporter substrate-binding protein [Thermotoga sp. KOL6]|uniref:ABC transporter substrate-binding protein n=1 Tax=Thermotoga sp. KOL6 TaxID=126741 RepID=UPI000C76A41E|nr:extracellular solute-binding protein [Thermotoga sp. KOL6]PLV59150.1 sugar ABC transporter substrate-binding protein [Thermotoga sp. KOL6]